MDEKIGRKLRQFREASKLGIKTAAPLVNVTYSYLSKIETGSRTPNKELVAKLCSIYGKNEEEVLALLGHVPPDILKMIENNGTEVFDFLRQNFKAKREKS